MINIAISCAAGSLKKFEALYFKKISIFKNKVRLIGLDVKSNKIDKKYFDFVAKLPKADSRNFLKKLKKIIIKYNINFIFIGADEEAVVISKKLKEFEKLGVKIMINPHKTIKVISNKIKTFKKLKPLKKIIPYWFQANNEKKLIKLIYFFINKFGSVVVKPAISRGGRNVFIIKKDNFIKKRITKREKDIGLSLFRKKYLKKLKKSYPLMVMEKLNNPVYDLDIIAQNGKAEYSLLRRRLNPRDPNSGHKILKRKDIAKIANRISKILKLETINDCDFMVDENNHLKLLEINPRPSGSFAVPNLAGINLLDYLIAKNLEYPIKIKLKKLQNDILISKNKLKKLYNA